MTTFGRRITHRFFVRNVRATRTHLEVLRLSSPAERLTLRAAIPSRDLARAFFALTFLDDERPRGLAH